MPDYKKLYHKTFNAITDAERLIETAAALLRIVQHECEELYIDTTDDTPEEEGIDDEYD